MDFTDNADIVQLIFAVSMGMMMMMMMMMMVVVVVVSWRSTPKRVWGLASLWTSRIMRHCAAHLCCEYDDDDGDDDGDDSGGDDDDDDDDDQLVIGV